MARKSNKTAHVLNLLSGQDTGDEAEKEPESAKEPGKQNRPKQSRKKRSLLLQKFSLLPSTRFLLIYRSLITVPKRMIRLPNRFGMSY